MLPVFFLLLLASSIQSDSCRDIHPSCQLLSQLDYCGQFAIMKFNCAQSCQFCGKFVGDCVDRLDNCGEYSKAGYCDEDDPLRVEYACPKTCNVCSKPV